MKSVMASWSPEKLNVSVLKGPTCDVCFYQPGVSNAAGWFYSYFAISCLFVCLCVCHSLWRRVEKGPLLDLSQPGKVSWNATGQVLPPFAASDTKQLNPLWRRGEILGTRYGLRKNGWTSFQG